MNPTMPELTPEPTEKAPYEYHAESQLLFGHLMRPIDLKIEDPASVSLGRRERYLFKRAEGLHLDGLISLRSGYTCVSGNYSTKHGWVTLGTAVLEGLNVLDVITADRVVAQVSTELAVSDREPHVTFLGTRFENLRICGYPVELEVDLRFCGDKPSDERRYLEEPAFLDRISYQIEGVFASMRGQPYLPDWMIKQYAAEMESLAYLRQRVKGSAPSEQYGRRRRVRCSLVKSVNEVAIPGVKSFGNAIFIPDFGTLFLGEIEVGERSPVRQQNLTYFGLTMIRMELGSIGEGPVGAAKIFLDGGGRPGNGGSDGEAARVWNGTAPSPGPPGEPLQEYASPTVADAAPAGALSPASSEVELSSDVTLLPTLRFKPSSFKQAFPWIVPTTEHVIQRANFDVEVSLRLTPEAGVEGSATLPFVERTFDIDVHLLLDDQSCWQTLKFSWAQETVSAAKFVGLTAPNFQGTAATPDFRTIRVNFYLDHRWCGEGLKNIEILSHAGMREAEVIPTPPTPEWRRYLNVTSESSIPPDLLVRIQEKSFGKYQWSFHSPHKNLQGIAPDECGMELKRGAESYVKSNFEPLAKIKLNDLTAARLEGTCKQIYEVTPPAFKEVYWDLYHASQKDPKIKLDTIQFVSDEPYVPWEIMRVEDDLRAPQVEGDILSVRHSVGRWLASESFQMRPNIPLQNIAIFASDYSTVDTVETKLKWAEQEAQDLATYCANRQKPKATRCKLISKDVLEFLKTGKAQVLHFSCHGRMDQQAPNASALIMEDDPVNFVPPVVTIAAIQKRGVGSQHPLVFLNACQLGGTGAELSFVTGWPQAFLCMGAAAVIAPLWSVGDESARAVAEEFYKVVVNDSPISLGAALQKIRAQFQQNEYITCLAYLLYGDPNAIISIV
jgi:hypothetical protein